MTLVKYLIKKCGKAIKKNDDTLPALR